MVLQFTRHKVQSFGVNFSLFSLSCILSRTISPGNSGCSAMDTKCHSLRQPIETETGTDCSTIFWKLKKGKTQYFSSSSVWIYFLREVSGWDGNSWVQGMRGQAGGWLEGGRAPGHRGQHQRAVRGHPDQSAGGHLERMRETCIIYVISAVLTPTCVHPILIRGGGHNSPEAGSERGQVWEEFWPRLGGVRGHTGTEAAGEQLTGDWSEDIILWGWRPGLLTCAEQTGWWRGQPGTPQPPECWAAASTHPEPGECYSKIRVIRILLAFKWWKSMLCLKLSVVGFWAGVATQIIAAHTHNHQLEYVMRN